MSGSWVGADPGGKRAFGLAFLDDDGSARCYTCSSTAEASSRISFEPLGVGIDAPMWWSAGPSGWRKSDLELRRAYEIGAGTVLCTNSLRGAALVQSLLLAELLRQRFPAVQITESHPKALLIACYKNNNRADNVRSFFRDFGITGTPEDEHQEDALIAAVCDREGFSRRWSLDLAEDRFPEEQDPRSYWLAPMHYWWPSDLTSTLQYRRR